MTCGIYKIKNNVNEKMYIGQSTNIEKRWKDHKNNSNYVYMNNHLYSGIRKYGLDNFTFSIICEVPENVLDVYEISYIKYYSTTDPKKGYNKTFGGEGGRKTDETKKKISAANKGKLKTDETKKKMSDAKKNMTDETKKKISDAKKNMTDETKKKISDANKKQHLYQGTLYNEKQDLADFLGISYGALNQKIRRKQINVTILSQSEPHLPS